MPRNNIIKSAAKPDYALAYEGLGRAFYNRGENGKAETNFQQALKLNPHLWQSHNYLGIIEDQRHHFEQAIAHYRVVIALKPKIGSLV